MMDLVQQLNATSAAVTAIVWTIAWQSMLLGIVVSQVARWLKRASPATRYWLWQILLLKILIMPLWIVAVPWPKWAVDEVTSTRTSLPHSVIAEPPPVAEAARLSGGETPDKAMDSKLPDEFEPRVVVDWSAWLLIGWVVIVLGAMCTCCDSIDSLESAAS